MVKLLSDSPVSLLVRSDWGLRSVNIGRVVSVGDLNFANPVRFLKVGVSRVVGHIVPLVEFIHIVRLQACDGQSRNEVNGNLSISHIWLLEFNYFVLIQKLNVDILGSFEWVNKT